MADQMALPRLGFGSFGSTHGFFAVRAGSAFGGALDALDAASVFAQPERVTRAVYFSRALGDFQKAHTGGSASSSARSDGALDTTPIGAVLVRRADDGAARDEPFLVERDFEAFDDFAEAAARADSVMDALVRWRDATSGGVAYGGDGADTGRSGREREREREPEPFRSWVARRAPTRDIARASATHSHRSRADADGCRPRGARFFGADANDALPPPFARALVGVASFLLVAAAAAACARATLAACDWACRAAFGEEEEEEEGASFAPSVDEVSLAAPLLVKYETEERAIAHGMERDGVGEDDGEQLLVLVPAEPEGFTRAAR